MFLELFLDDPEKFKLSLYRDLLQMSAGDYSLHYFDQKYKASYAKIQSAFLGLHSDLFAIGSYELFQKDTGRIHLTETLPSLESYQHFLLENSLLIRVFYYLLFKPEKTIQDFCRENFLSRSTVFRKLQPMETILSPFNIRFQPSKLKLTGSEAGIRYFLCNLLWYLGPALLIEETPPSPEKKELLQQLTQIFDPYTQPVMEKKLSLTLAICEARRKAGYFIEEVLPEENILLPPEILHHPYLDGYLEETTPSAYLLAENHYLYFLIFSGPIHTTKEALTYEFFKEWMAEETPQKQLIFKFLKDVFQELFYENVPENADLLFANLLGVFNVSLNLKNPAPVLATFLGKDLRPEEAGFTKLEATCLKMLQKCARRKDFSWLGPCVSALGNNFAYCLWPAYRHELQFKKLKVSLLLDANFYFRQPLEEFLTTFPFVEVAPFKKNDVDCQLLIVQHENLAPKEFTETVFLYTHQSLRNNFAALKRLLFQLEEKALA